MSSEATSSPVTAALENAGSQDLVCPAGLSLYQEQIVDYWSFTVQRKPYFIVYPKRIVDAVQVLKAI
jgi:hypothetical protein